MKFVRPPGQTPLDLSADILQLGDAMELVHFSEWKPEQHGGEKGCWAEHLDPIEMLKVIDDKENSTVLQSAPEDFENDVRAWIKMRQDPDEYFENPLQCLLPEGSDFEKREIHAASDKEKIRDFVLDYSRAHGNDSCTESIQALFEELFMNATLDAPRESGGAQPGDIVSVYLAADERRIGIAFQDPYGSLKLAKLLGRMREVYERGAGDAINLHGPGGAGLGCVIMLEKSSLICFGVIPGQVTIVSCLVPRHWSNRKRASMKKSLHLVLTKTK